MRPILRKTVLCFTSSSSSSQARTFVVRLQSCEFTSSSSSPPNRPHHWRRLEDESRNVRVSVWWDFENCNVPSGFNVLKVAPSITDAVRANGIKGPIHITAFGDVNQLSKPNQEALSFTGVHLTHIPGGRNSADRSLLVDLMYWVSQNPPPAHLFLISGDTDFAGILHRLRMNNYNILLASSGRAPSEVLCSAATIMWQWSSMLRGEDLIGKHFNHPPDGPHGSWYGNFKTPLENPFSAAEKSISSQNVETQAPNSVAKRVRHILKSHPNGISIGDLRAELTKCNVQKRVFGPKGFSRFLLSMPEVELQCLGEGNFLVQLVASKSAEHFESSTAPLMTAAVKNEERGYTATPKLHSEGKNINGDAYEIPSMSSLNESSVDDDSTSYQSIPSQGKPIEEYVDVKSSFPSFEEKHVCQPPDKLQKSSLCSEKVLDVANAQLSENETSSFKMSSNKSSDDHIVMSEDVCQPPDKLQKSSLGSEKVLDVANAQLSENETSSFKMSSNKSSDDHIVMSEDVSPKTLEKCPTSQIDDSLVEKRSGENAETYSRSSTFFSWIKSWWPFWKSSAKSDDLITHQNKVVSNFEDLKLSEPNQTASLFEDPKSSKPQQDVTGNPELFEDAKLSELGQAASHFEEPKSSEPHRDVTGNPELFEDAKLSELGQVASHSEEPKSSEPQQGVSHLVKRELFSSDSFWKEIKSFVFTAKGSGLISLSRSREDLSHKLRKHGPLILMSLSENDILQLVELLIVEKKWLEQIPSQACPFRLNRSVQKTSLLGQSHGANELRSLFLNETSKSKLQKPFEHDVEKRCQSVHQTRVSKPATETKYTERSRSDILVDCQKLVSEILREYPMGYDTGGFRKLFATRYGYQLDVKKLGYRKLTSLLQIMPGVQLDSNILHHAVCVSDSDNESSESAPKEDSVESTWEELGPVNESSQNDLASKIAQKVVELDTTKNPDYESVLSEYESSESEGDSSYLTQPEEQGKPKCNEQDSSFWEALDLWHSSKEEENRVNKSDNVDITNNSLCDILNSSTDSTRGTISQSIAQTIAGNHREKQRSQKNYLFVADPELPDKDKFIGGILDGLKKADESKMQH